MGGILQHAKVEGFLQNRERVNETADQESTEWLRVCLKWHDMYGDIPVTSGKPFENAIAPYKLLLHLWADRRDLGGEASHRKGARKTTRPRLRQLRHPQGP